MTTPRRGLLFHFTHISNLVSIAKHGLYSDNALSEKQTKFAEVGEPRIKRARRARKVLGSPGNVGDYVPFYFAARSPMLYSLHMGNVPTYADDQDGIVYLVTDVDELQKSSRRLVFTDRSAVFDSTRFSRDLGELDEFIDWQLMESQSWRDSRWGDEGTERRMAEMLVYRLVPWDAFLGVATRSRGTQPGSVTGAGYGWRRDIRRRPAGVVLLMPQFIDSTGNLLDAEVDALVNTVNTVGVMGKGHSAGVQTRVPAELQGL